MSRAQTIEKLRERYPRLDIEEREYEDARGRNVGIVASCDEFPATATWRTYKVWATGPPTPEHVAEAEAKLVKLRTALTPVGEDLEEDEATPRPQVVCLCGGPRQAGGAAVGRTG